MVLGNIGRALQVRNGSCHPKDAMDRPAAEVHSLGGSLQQAPGRGRQESIPLQHGSGQRAVEGPFRPPGALAGARHLDSLANHAARLAGHALSKQLPGRLSQNSHLQVDAVSDGP
jgi:hypothetical protein